MFDCFLSEDFHAQEIFKIVFHQNVTGAQTKLGKQNDMPTTYIALTLHSFLLHSDLSGLKTKIAQKMV